MKLRATTSVLESLGVLALLGLLWWLASHQGWISRVFLPTPEATLASLNEGLRGELLGFMGDTVLRMLLGLIRPTEGECCSAGCGPR